MCFEFMFVHTCASVSPLHNRSEMMFRGKERTSLVKIVSYPANFWVVSNITTTMCKVTLKVQSAIQFWFFCCKPPPASSWQIFIWLIVMNRMYCAVTSKAILDSLKSKDIALHQILNEKLTVFCEFAQETNLCNTDTSANKVLSRPYATLYVSHVFLSTFKHGSLAHAVAFLFQFYTFSSSFAFCKSNICAIYHDVPFLWFLAPSPALGHLQRRMHFLHTCRSGT